MSLADALDQCEKNHTESPYIERTLKEELAKGSQRTSVHLSLAGNNYLKTKDRLQNLDANLLYVLLKNNSSVVSLDLRYNNFDDDGAKHIAKLLEETSAIEQLNLMGNDIGPAGAAALGESLQVNRSLKTLKLTGNKIGCAGGMALAQMLQVNTTLESLDIADTDQNIESIIAMATVLKSNTTLRHINLSRPILFSVTEEVTVHVAELLQSNKSLESLTLHKYDMRDFGCQMLAQSLLHNDALTHLDLSSNRITRDGLEELAYVFRKNTPLAYLDLSNNRLECPGAMKLADALGYYNNHLQTIVVRSNNIKGQGLCALADALTKNNSVRAIYIWGNVHEEPACIAFASLLQTGRIGTDCTDVEPYVVDGVTYLAERNTSPLRHYYWKPVYGSDIPPVDA